MGELDGKGRKVLSVGYCGKRVSKDDIPLSSLAVPILNDLLPHINYETREQFDADIGLLKEFVNGLQLNEVMAGVE
jgi:hypothetical protein